jgi:integrase
MQAELTDAKLKALKPKEKPYKVTDGKGLYVVVSPAGSITFRLDYRLNSTISMRKSILDRDILPVFGNRRLEEITTKQVMDLCEKIKARGAPATAVHAKETIQQVYRQAKDRGIDIVNPAEAIKSSAIAKFKSRNRPLSPDNIRVFFNTLENIGTMPTLKMAIKFLCLTLVRKSELINATWDEVDFEKAVWSIPAKRMKMENSHNVYLSQQALDILIALKIEGRCSMSADLTVTTHNELRDQFPPTCRPFAVWYNPDVKADHRKWAVNGEDGITTRTSTSTRRPILCPT